MPALPEQTSFERVIELAGALQIDDAEVADAWTSRPVAYTHRDEPLGLRPPTWDAFCHHLSYAIGLGESAPPGCELEPWRE